MTTATRVDLIRDRITTALSPTFLEVIDESDHHVGHVGAQSGAGHFQVEIASPVFVGKSKVQCHRLVYDALGDAMGGHIHAVSILIREK